MSVVFQKLGTAKCVHTNSLLRQLDTVDEAVKDQTLMVNIDQKAHISSNTVFAWKACLEGGSPNVNVTS